MASALPGATAGPAPAPAQPQPEAQAALPRLHTSCLHDRLIQTHVSLLRAQVVASHSRRLSSCQSSGHGHVSFPFWAWYAWQWR
jgi:hypothetical protein